jgi:hypothetical protein
MKRWGGCIIDKPLSQLQPNSNIQAAVMTNNPTCAEILGDSSIVLPAVCAVDFSSKFGLLFLGFYIWSFVLLLLDSIFRLPAFKFWLLALALL